MPSTLNLVIQSPGLEAGAITQVAALSQSVNTLSLSPFAVRLLNVRHDADTRAAVAAWCDTHAIDYAWMPAGSRFSDYRVLAMDMDSTLINIECIDEIAAAVGRKAEVSAITEAAMRGEITDFAESLRRRVALLAGVPASALEDVYTQRLRLNPGAGQLLEAAHAHGLRTLLVSGGFTFFTERLRTRLDLTAAHANTLEVRDGVLTGQVLGDIVDAQAKQRLLLAFAKEDGANAATQAIALGDGANDLKMLGAAALGVAYHAKPVVRAAAGLALTVSGLDGVLNWFEDTAPGA